MSDMICSRLRELRRKNGYTQSGLAKKLNVSQPTIASWEAGIRRPNIDTLERITRLFGVSVGWLFGEQEIKAELEKVKRERDRTGRLYHRRKSLPGFVTGGEKEGTCRGTFRTVYQNAA